VNVNGVLGGELRAPVNYAAGRSGSIHSDAAAQAIGFKGGLVSGLVHNDAFMPLALRAFGPPFFERGCYSFFYRTPTFDLEPVRAFLQDPGERTQDVQVRAWSETEDGRRVAEGTVSIGDLSEPTELRRRFAQRPASGELRILRDVRAGQALPEEARRFPLVPPSNGEGQLQRRDIITEPLEWYFGPSPWGGPIASSLALARLLRPSLRGVHPGGTLGVDGGIEVRFVDGPVFVDTDYVVSGQVLGVSESPKTENLWWESALREAASGRVVARMLMLSRIFKHGSPLYTD
jgi:hypothetical protein